MKYHQKIIIIFIMLIWNCLAGAQHVITGIVCDKDTQLPVSDVYVNLDEFTYAITNISGKFELKTNSENNTKMTLQHVAYQTVVIDSPFVGLPDTLFVIERINRISEVTISAISARKKSKMIKRVAVVEFIIGKDNSINSLKLIRSTGYPSLDAMALEYSNNFSNFPSELQREKPTRWRHTFHVEKNGFAKPVSSNR